jgi:outer membrane receptor protein involved in Fe transport
MRRHVVVAALLMFVCILAGLPAAAQQTTGTITGRVVDQTGAAVPGATVTAHNAATGFSRTAVTDSVGVYRLGALPVGKYDLKAELSGFQTVERKDMAVNVGQTIDIELSLRMASVAETVTVTGASPLIETTSSSVGGVVDVNKIESLPLNGRQFANLAMTVAGVGMGFHSDPTKSTQYSPQVAGGNGRNVNYQIDGGDNNDDTVGGLLQLFPLEAIEQFNMITSRYKAEYGRSNGGVMNIVTKSGQNAFGGSAFGMGRDKSLNARTKTEEINNLSKQYYRRYQFGGSFGGPVVQNRVHFFAAAERTDQTTRQAVNTLGLFPSLDGVYDTPMDENLFTTKVSMNLDANHYLAVRYGRNTNSQTYGVGSRTPPESWGDSKNKFNSVNVNYNWVLGGSKLNEFILQYADFQNNITARSNAPQETFPNGVGIGYNSNTPQTTTQHKWQFRDDFSWHMQGLGLGHDLKTGANFIYEPKLYITFNSGSGAYSYTHLDLDKAGKISGISLGSSGAGVNLPMKQTALYLQDDWRLTDRLTLNLGVRYDLVTGFAINQSGVTNFQVMQAAGKAGRFNGIPAFEDWGKDPKEDKNNIQPRIGIAWDVRGDGRDLVRAGWGLYYDFGYTNANILFAGLNTVGGQGAVFTVSGVSAGIKNKDGSYFKVGDPIANITSPNEVLNPNGPFFNSHVASPRILQPYTDQWSAGWSHQLTRSTVLDLDYVGTRGHDLGVRFPLNTRINGGARRFADLPLSPANPTYDLSIGASKFDGLTVGMRRRMDKHFQINGWYMISRAIGLGGLGIDELTTNLVQDANNPFADVQWGPANRTDARHKVTISAVIEAPFGINISPIYRYRSALPLHIWLGYDANNDGVNNDIATKAYRFNGLDGNNKPTWKETGACGSINCGRGAAQQQMNLRVSKVFTLAQHMHLEVIGEVFNLFNNINPAFGTGAGTAGRLYTGTAAAPVTNANFMLPTGYSGDSGLPEQRVGQFGIRVTF